VNRIYLILAVPGTVVEVLWISDGTNYLWRRGIIGEMSEHPFKYCLAMEDGYLLILLLHMAYCRVILPNVIPPAIFPPGLPQP